MDWTEAAGLLVDARHILIVTHVSPDGDAIGSLLGLTWSLRQIGKQVTPAVDGGVPAFLQFVPGAEDVAVALTEPEFDLLIAVDCGDEQRMGEVGAAALATGKPVINVDHHVTNTLFGTANLVDARTVSTTEVLYDWLPRLGVRLDEQIATCLLTGLVTDTLGFRTPNVTAPVLGKAQRLMETGANLADITQRALQTKPYTDIQLWSLALPTVKLEDGVIWAVIDQAIRAQAGSLDNTDAGLVSFLLSAEEAHISAVFREREDGRIELGFRAVPGYDVGTLAVNLGGGGHTLASGATIDGPLDAALARTLPLLKVAAQASS